MGIHSTNVSIDGRIRHMMKPIPHQEVSGKMEVYVCHFYIFIRIDLLEFFRQPSPLFSVMSTLFQSAEKNHPLDLKDSAEPYP
jgi:hypothetical protein